MFPKCDGAALALMRRILFGAPELSVADRFRIALDTGKNAYPEEIEWEIGRTLYVEEVLVRPGNAWIEAVVFPHRERLEAGGLLEWMEHSIADGSAPSSP